jgi:hypothetical protein
VALANRWSSTRRETDHATANPPAASFSAPAGLAPASVKKVRLVSGYPSLRSAPGSGCGDLGDVGDLSLGFLLVTEERGGVDGRGGVARRGLARQQALLRGGGDDLVGLGLDLLGELQLRAEAGDIVLWVDRLHLQAQLL